MESTTYRITTDQVAVEFDDKGHVLCRTCGYEETATLDDGYEPEYTLLMAARESANWHTTECDR